MNVMILMLIQEQKFDVELEDVHLILEAKGEIVDSLSPRSDF